MEPRIFRKAALERLSSPEQLDQLMRVTTPRGWLSLAALGGLLVVALLWAVLGRVPTQVAGPGIFLRGDGVKTVVAAAAGRVRAVDIRAGDLVDEGQVVATVAPIEAISLPGHEAQPLRVTSPHRGRILEVMVERGSVVTQSTVLATLEPVADPLELVVYLPAGEGKKVRPGMAAQIEPATASRQEFGVLRGRVRAVADFPSTQAGMMRTLQNDRLVQAFLAAGPPYEVRVELVAEPGSPSGFQWSSSGGPPFAIGGGTLARALITIREQRPIGLVLPVLND